MILAHLETQGQVWDLDFQEGVGGCTVVGDGRQVGDEQLVEWQRQGLLRWEETEEAVRAYYLLLREVGWQTGHPGSPDSGVPVRRKRGLSAFAAIAVLMLACCGCSIGKMLIPSSYDGYMTIGKAGDTINLKRNNREFDKDIWISGGTRITIDGSPATARDVKELAGKSVHGKISWKLYPPIRVGDSGSSETMTEGEAESLSISTGK